jgi:4-diphosphocytidyl-2-C-methyl-D-erythritol kinase
MTSWFAAAKINLALHVTGRREDGYHLLDSAVMFAADAGDRLHLAAADSTSLTIEGPFSAGLETDAGNLVLRAINALQTAFPGQVAHYAITLEKNLPVASGIGGGSADAAAALNAVIAGSDLKPAPEQVSRIALSLGADVPVCLASTACRMSGIGETVEPWPGAPRMHAVLVNPGVAVSTAAIFKALALTPGQAVGDGMSQMPGSGELGHCLEWLQDCRNDLEPPARALQPVIAEVLEAIAATAGCRLDRMSGSGATCFGLYETAATASAAATALRNSHPGWWIAPTRLV